MKFSFWKQLLVQAYDDGYPALSDTEVVSITVNRNLQPPVFTTNSIEITILESQALGVAITTATANDPDALVSRTDKCPQCLDKNRCFYNFDV